MSVNEYGLPKITELTRHIKLYNDGLAVRDEFNEIICTFDVRQADCFWWRVDRSVPFRSIAKYWLFNGMWWDVNKMLDEVDAWFDHGRIDEYQRDLIYELMKITDRCVWWNPHWRVQLYWNDYRQRLEWSSVEFVIKQFCLAEMKISMEQMDQVMLFRRDGIPDEIDVVELEGVNDDDTFSLGMLGVDDDDTMDLTLSDGELEFLDSIGDIGVIENE